MRRAAMLLIGLMLAVPSLAAERYEFDYSHTRVMFDVSHLGFSMMPGIFRDYEIEFAFDPDTPADSTLAVTIQAASVDMFHDGLNEHLRNEDFFDVATYPTLEFRSTSVEAIGEGTARVTGDLTLLGETHPVTFEVDLVRHAPDPRSGTMKAGFSARGSLDRTDFGMGYGAPMVGAEVNFEIIGEALRAGN